ncbi:hypothetical protein E4T43_06392 [Aureobasidium subglaciale]|nr:hypothetical protein E4T43_06392 [Aureobasidium subglaciale]
MQDTIEIRGRYFLRDDKRVLLGSADTSNFIIRGVTYQVRETRDPISDDFLPRLKRDVELFKELGLNTLFVCSSATPHLTI